MISAQANLFYERAPWKGSVLFSAGMHLLFAASIYFMGFVLQPHGSSQWGDHEGDAINAKLVAAAPVPLPAPQQATDNILASESKGVTQSVQKKAVETEDGITIPGKTVKRVEKAPPVPSNIRPRPTPTPPETAVPYGEGGPVSGPYGVFTAPNTKGGFSFQDADFGTRFGWYVQVVRNKVHDNWLTYELGSGVQATHRGYIQFDIRRDGSPANVRLEQSSGVPALDQSAMRAVQRIDTFGRLPDGYTGSQVTVEFWFDYPPK
ncbi:MAG TPA: energy transducer TonB [Alphaproteobacteria bacterium]|nr:energy transducer TonB [Alphaproteobacteria bacterium]